MTCEPAVGGEPIDACGRARSRPSPSRRSASRPIRDASIGKLMPRLSNQVARQRPPPTRPIEGAALEPPGAIAQFEEAAAERRADARASPRSDCRTSCRCRASLPISQSSSAAARCLAPAAGRRGEDAAAARRLSALIMGFGQILVEHQRIVVGIEEGEQADHAGNVAGSARPGGRRGGPARPWPPRCRRRRRSASRRPCRRPPRARRGRH